MSVGQQLSPDAKYQLALKMPIERLMAIIRGQPAQIDPATALAALKMHNQTKVAAQGQQAQQQLQQPDVANQEMQMASLPENSGVGRLTANNMNGIATAAQGGIIGYADGGDVQHFQVGGRPESTIGQWWRNLPVNKAGAYANSAEGQAASQRMAALTTEREQTIIPPYQAVTPEERKTRESRLADIENEMSVIRSGRSGASGFGPNYTPAPSQTDASQAYLEQLKQPIPDSVAAPAAAPAARNAAPAARNASVAPASGVQLLPTGPMPAEQGLMMGGEKQTPEGLAALQQGPVGSTPDAGVTALRRPTAGLAGTTLFQNAFSQISGTTNSYVDKMTDLIKQMTPTTEEKEKKRNEDKGITALRVAGKLFKSGTTESGARGLALEEIGDLTQQFRKEDREDKKAEIGAQIGLLGAQAQLAQGNTKAALDMYQHAEKLAFEGIRFDAEKMFKQEELRLKGLGLSSEKAYNDARIAMQKYVSDAETTWRTHHTNALLSGQERADARTDARASATERGQNLRAKVDILKEQLKQVGLSPDRKKQLETDIAGVTAKLNEDLGIATLPKPPSIQLPDSSGAGEPIYSSD